MAHIYMYLCQEAIKEEFVIAAQLQRTVNLLNDNLGAGS